MQHKAIKAALLASYEADGGINHLDGTNLPTQESMQELARDFMHLLFPGYFEASRVTKREVPDLVDQLLRRIEKRLSTEVDKCLRYGKVPDHAKRAGEITGELLGRMPDLRKLVHTDVSAAYEGDPAARSIEEIILAYPCVLVISLQRVAHVLHRLGVPLLPRMITEYGHERTGTDIHPGAEIGTHFFIDHCTGVVIGETATIGSHVKLYQGVTLGAKSFELDQDGNPVKGVKRHPDIEDHVTIYSNTTILGGGTRVGANSIIGANVWLLESVPAGSIAYYKGESLVVRAREKKETIIGEANDWVI